MTKDEFQQWWFIHASSILHTAVCQLEALRCQDTEIAATILVDRLEEYLGRTCERYDQEGLLSLCTTAIIRRARNHMRNSIRKHGLHVDLSLETILEQPEDYSALLTRAELSCAMETDVIQQQHVRLTLAAMTLKDRDLLLCTIVEGWTIEDVSRKMGYPQRTGAQAAINRAKARFKAIWKQKGYDADTPPSVIGGSASGGSSSQGEP